MEFEELKKIWDSQNNQPMYAINEAALHKRIQVKMKQASHLNNITDMGLICICLATAVLSLLISRPARIWDYIIAIELVIIAGYIIAGRIERKKQETRYDGSLLGNLDHAINNVAYEVQRSKTMIWWFLLPLAIPVFLSMAEKQRSIWQWVFIAAAFVLAYLVIRRDYLYKHIPRQRKLEALRQQLLADEPLTKSS